MTKKCKCGCGWKVFYADEMKKERDAQKKSRTVNVELTPSRLNKSRSLARLQRSA